ncbi:recombinase family protein [Streptomyces sp. NBC_00704]|uniref:recombinase family protein n=1 Tax=Streptomyces sp. NBC_00704 TaxID=2975809 RepID=UPI003FA72C09
MRVSTAEQKGRFGIPAQAQAIREFVEQWPSWSLVGSQQDAGESGSAYSRPGFDALLDDIAAARVKIVLVHRLDRLGRTEAAIWRCIWQIEDAGGRVECCTEPLGERGVERWRTVDRLAQVSKRTTGALSRARRPVGNSRRSRVAGLVVRLPTATGSGARARSARRSRWILLKPGW